LCYGHTKRRQGCELYAFIIEIRMREAYELHDLSRYRTHHRGFGRLARSRLTLWLASLLIIFILLTAPTGRPTFLFFTVTIDHSLSGVFSPYVLYTSLSIEAVAKIRKSVNSVCLIAFTRSISFTLARHSADHDV